MSDTAPLVSVLLPVYNGEPYLRGAIESILNQTYPNFELIILNDGSADDSQLIIDSYMSHSRIRAYQHPNKGLPATLNRGIELAHGELIARMDQDDVAAPDRLSKQTAYLESNPLVVVLGSAYRVIDKNGQALGVRYQLCAPHHVQRQMYTGNPFCHGSVMFRKSAIETVGGYDPNAHIEDYDLWSRVLAMKVGNMANLKDVLYEYRINNSTSMVATNHHRYVHETEIVRERLWSLGTPPSLFGQGWRANLTDGPTLAYGTHNRTQRELHLITGLHIMHALLVRGYRRRALMEWIGLCLLHGLYLAQLARLLKHLPLLIGTRKENTL